MNVSQVNLRFYTSKRTGSVIVNDFVFTVKKNVNIIINKQ